LVLEEARVDTKTTVTGEATRFWGVLRQRVVVLGLSIQREALAVQVVVVALLVLGMVAPAQRHLSRVMQVAQVTAATVVVVAVVLVLLAATAMVATVWQTALQVHR
jgi:protein-S-isoprenylcysteine O-methyltransferase Ste14